MDTLIKLVLIGLALSTFALFNAAIVDNVGSAQLDIMYNCYVEYTETEFRENCRNELDGFGHMTDLAASRRQYAALAAL